MIAAALPLEVSRRPEVLERSHFRDGAPGHVRRSASFSSAPWSRCVRQGDHPTAYSLSDGLRPMLTPTGSGGAWFRVAWVLRASGKWLSRRVSAVTAFRRTESADHSSATHPATTNAGCEARASSLGVEIAVLAMGCREDSGARRNITQSVESQFRGRATQWACRLGPKRRASMRSGGLPTQSCRAIVGSKRQVAELRTDLALLDDTRLNAGWQLRIHA